MQYELLSEMDTPEQDFAFERATRDRIYKTKNPMGSRALGPHLARALRIWINKKWPQAAKQDLAKPTDDSP